MEFDVSYVRTHFPALARGWALFDNAGGSVVPKSVTTRVSEYMTQLGVQLGASYALSVEADAAVAAGITAAAQLIGCEPDEVVLGNSSTANVYVLAQALAAGFVAGDEIVVTNVDHEANIGAWRRLAERGMKVREWQVRPETMRLELDDLDALLNERTRLVCCTHVSNVVGAIHNIPAIAARVHDAEALLCVDGVAHAPHRRVDVAELGVDFYLVSLYKVFGPHVGLMYMNSQHVHSVENQNRYFVESGPYKFEPGNVNHELTSSLPGILDYLGAVDKHHGSEHPDGQLPGGVGTTETSEDMLTRVFERFAAHESRLAGRLLEFLDSRPGVRVIGPKTAEPDQRVATVSFTVRDRHASEIPALLDRDQIAVRWGDFYAARLIDALNLRESGGVVRVSMAHYNTDEEITALIQALDRAL